MSDILKLTTAVFLLSLNTYTVFSQKLLHEVTSKEDLSDFNAVAIGDSLLFSYEEKVAGIRVKKAKWITDSAAIPYHLPINVFSAANIGGEIYLYYLNGKAKSRELNAAVLIAQTNIRKELNTHLPLQGTIIGSYVDRNLFILLLQDKGINLSILEINGLNVVSEKKFKLPVNLSYDLWREFSGDFFSSQSYVHSFKGNAKCKIFNYDKVYLTLDQRNPSSPWTTLVIALDPSTNSVTTTEFRTRSNDAFSSFILDGKLFRSFIGKKKFSLEIYDVASKELLAQSDLLAKQEEFPIYFRYGRKNLIHTKEFLSDMMKLARGGEPSLVVHKNNGKYIVQWGTYFDDNGSMMIVPATPVGMLASVVGTFALYLAEGPGVNRYFYYEWDENHNAFKVKASNNQLIREKIDNYEISQHLSRIGYKYKNYVEFKDGVVGIYYNTKNNTVSLVNFN